MCKNLFANRIRHGKRDNVLRLDQLPCDILRIICDHLEYDAPSLKALRLTCCNLGVFSTETLFRTVLVYHRPQSWEKLNDIAAQPSLSRMVHKVQIAMLGPLPSFSQVSGWREHAKHVAGNEFCPIKKVFYLSGREWWLSGNWRKWNRTMKHWNNYCQWEADEQDMVLHNVRLNNSTKSHDESKAENEVPKLILSKLSGLRTIETVSLEALKAGLSYGLLKRERDCWVKDAANWDWEIEWPLYDVMTDEISDLDVRDTVEHFVAWQIWARNTPLSSFLCSIQQGPSPIVSLELSNMSEILSTTVYQNALDPPFDLIHLRRLALNFQNSGWNDLQCMSMDRGDLLVYTAIDWTLANWVTNVIGLKTLTIKQDPHLYPELDLVGLLMEVPLPDLETVQFEHCHTMANTMGRFIAKHQDSLKEMSVVQPVIWSLHDWAELRDKFAKSGSSISPRLHLDDAFITHMDFVSCYHGRYSPSSSKAGSILGD